MKKMGRFFMGLGIGSVALFCTGLILHFSGFITLPTYMMVAVGIVLCVSYAVVPQLAAKRAEYEPAGIHVYIWILLFLCDLAFLSCTTILVVQRLMRGA